MNLDDLFESMDSITIGIIFGRFNPPHQGHRAAWELAADNHYWYVGTNENTNGPKDPLPFIAKVKAMRAVFPEIRGHIMAETNWLTMATTVHNVLNKDGNAILKVYTDEDWPYDLLTRYNGQEGKNHNYNFKEIISVPTPRLSSATDLREAVKNEDPDAFYKAAGVSPDTIVDGVPYYNLVDRYLRPYVDSGEINESKGQINEGIFDIFGKDAKHKQAAYPIAAELYQRLLADPEYQRFNKLAIAAKVAQQFGFKHPKEFVSYLKSGKHHLDRESLPEAMSSWEKMRRAHKRNTGVDLNDVDNDIERIKREMEELSKKYQAIVDRDKQPE